MKCVYICSPYSGDIATNTSRAKRYCYFAYIQGAVPIAPHLHNTQFLHEDIPEERQAGIHLGIELLKRTDEIWCFGDYLSVGMRAELTAAQQMKLPVRWFTDVCEEVVR